MGDGPILLAFEIERGKVCIIDKEGERIPLFPASRLSRSRRRTGQFSESLRQAIITLMSDEA